MAEVYKSQVNIKFHQRLYLERMVRVIDFSSSSFKIRYEFVQGSQTHAVVKMVHTCIDSKTFQKLALPDIVKTKLQPFYDEMKI